MRALCELRYAAGLALAVVVALLAATPASALRLPRDDRERVNELGSGLPGTPPDTDPASVHYDEISSTDPHPGAPTVSGGIPELNYHTTTSSINVNHTFGMPLGIERIDITRPPAKNRDGVKASVGSAFAPSTSQLVIPEPATVLLMSLGLMGLVALTRMLPDNRS